MKNLLYLEDDDALSAATIRAFEKRGFSVHHYKKSSDALTPIQNLSFSHALLDLRLEDDSSIYLIPEIKKHSAKARIVVFTGYASIATAVQAIKLGATNYLSKPASISEIISAFEDETEENSNQHTEPDAEPMSVKRLEWEHIQRALIENNGNISATARQLNMHRRTLQRKLQKKPVSK